MKPHISDMFIYYLYASKVIFLPHHCPYSWFLRPHNSLTVGEPFLLTAARVNFVPGNVKYALLLHSASCFFVCLSLAAFFSGKSRWALFSNSFFLNAFFSTFRLKASTINCLMEAWDWSLQYLVVTLGPSSPGKKSSVRNNNPVAVASVVVRLQFSVQY